MVFLAVRRPRPPRRYGHIVDLTPPKTRSERELLSDMAEQQRRPMTEAEILARLQG